MLRILKTLLPLFLVTFQCWGAPSEISVNFNGLPSESLSSAKIEKFENLKGKVVLVDFWASWCGPCKEALPHYNRLYLKYKEKGVVFIGINEDEDRSERDKFLKTNRVEFPMYADSEQKMLKNFKVQAIPSLFVFDKNLKPVALFRGFSDAKMKNLEKKIQELLK